MRAKKAFVDLEERSVIQATHRRCLVKTSMKICFSRWLTTRPITNERNLIEKDEISVRLKQAAYTLVRNITKFIGFM